MISVNNQDFYQCFIENCWYLNIKKEEKEEKKIEGEKKQDIKKLIRKI